MSLQKGFLRGADIEIDHWLIATGILLSAIISFCFYAFFIYISEAFRGILLEFTSSLLLLDESDVSFYGYTLALLASVIGQGFGLRLILSAINRNRQFKRRFGLRVNMHNIRFTLWLWLFWVCDWLCMMGVISSSLEVHYDLDIRAELGYLFFLLPFVWFLTYWLQAYRIFQKKKRLKWIIGAFLYLCVSTLIIGNIRLVNYEQLNEQYSSTFPEYGYKMQIAESRTQSRIRRAASSTKIYLIWDGHEAKAVFSGFKSISFVLQDSAIAKRIQSIKESFTEVERYNIKFILTVDTRIPTSSLLAFERILSENGIHQVIYRTSVENSKYPWHYPPFQRTGVPKFLGPDCSAAKKLSIP